jgi:hypothetical protein
MLVLQALDIDSFLTDELVDYNWFKLAEIQDERFLVIPGLFKEDYFALVESRGTIWDEAEMRDKDWSKDVILEE